MGQLAKYNAMQHMDNERFQVEHNGKFISMQNRIILNRKGKLNMCAGKNTKRMNEMEKMMKRKPKKSQDRSTIARALHIIWLARKCISKQN